MKHLIPIVVFEILFSFSALAQTVGAEKFYKDAQESWAKRADIDAVKKTVELLERACSADPDNEKYRVELAIACYETLPATAKKERLDYYTKGEEAGLKAVSLNRNSVGGNFWAVVNNGRITELKGILSGSFNFGRCLKSMTTVASYEPNYYFGGVYRYWGQFIFEMPSMLRSVAQFTLEDAIYFFRRSLEVEPNFFMTRLYLAETYLANKQPEKARKELQWVVNNSPGLLPEAEPENRLYQKMAQDILDREFPGNK